MNDSFSTYHPIINFIFFVLVIGSAMVFMHPVLLVISLISAFCYSFYLKGKQAMRFNLGYLLPMILIVSLINPLFNHRGMTILWYFRDNPITLESIYYGIGTGLMFGAVILWFSCYNVIMTSDKFIYLFGRIIPSTSLLFSMVLRFVPKFKTQITRISNGQKCIGRDVSNGKYRERVYHGMKILSIMTTWALENAIETADSMKARGYGLSGRTHFSLFRFDGRDKSILSILLLFAIIILAGAITGQNSVQFFPVFQWNSFSPLEVMVYLVYSVLCFYPLLLNLVEDLRWKNLQ